MKKIILTLIITMLILLTSCSNTLDNSDSVRKITVYNTTTDMILLDLTDVFTVSRDKQALTVKQADNKTHYIYLTDTITYVIVDVNVDNSSDES